MALADTCTASMLAAILSLDEREAGAPGAIRPAAGKGFAAAAIGMPLGLWMFRADDQCCVFLVSRRLSWLPAHPRDRLSRPGAVSIGWPLGGRR
jgi:hypothetical protein